MSNIVDKWRLDNAFELLQANKRLFEKQRINGGTDTIENQEKVRIILSMRGYFKRNARQRCRI